MFWYILIILAALLVAFAAFCLILFRVAVVGDRKLVPGYVGKAEPGVFQKYAPLINGELDWLFAQAPERVYMTSYDGLRLAGLWLPTEGAKGTMLLMHGYRSSPYRDFSCAYRTYRELGYNILSVFQRAHGESEGKYICYGVKERFDCRDWCRFINQKTGSQNDIFLAGISMGCSTVLMATGLQLPENVRGVIADCGFASPWDEFSYLLKKRMHLPVHPLLDIVSAMSRRIAGFGFRDCSAVDAMAENTLPILFFHGDGDNFVPPYMSRMNYDACKAPKELIVTPEAGHGMSYLYATERYVAAVEAFLGKYSTVQ